MSENTGGAVNPAPGCPVDDMVEKYALGRLGEGPEETAFEEHLFLCAQCQNRLAETDIYHEAMREAIRTAPERVAFGVKLREWLTGFATSRQAWLAVSAVAVLLLLFLPSVRWSGVPAVNVDLYSMRGSTAPVTAVTSGTPIQLRIHLRESPPAAPLVVDVVDDSGNLVKESVPAVSGTTLSVGLADGLAEGQYWVRVRRSDDGAISEYGLSVRR